MTRRQWFVVLYRLALLAAALRIGWLAGWSAGAADTMRHVEAALRRAGVPPC